MSVAGRFELLQNAATAANAGRQHRAERPDRLLPLVEP